MGSDIERLMGQIANEIGEWATWPGGWPEEADTALIDAVYSARARYETVVRPLITRYQSWDGRQPGGDLRALIGVDRDALLAQLNNQQVVPGGSGKLKVDAVIETAAGLVQEGFNTPDEIRSAAGNSPWAIRSVMHRTNGIGVATSNYFLMLMGVDGVKADTMILGFVERALDRTVGQKEGETLVGQASERLSCSRIDLDHAIWSHESTRRRAHADTLENQNAPHIPSR